MAVVAVEIGGNPVTTRYGSLSIEKRIEERSTASFVVIDKPGTGDFPRGTPIEIFDAVPALIFAGFIDTPEQDEIAPGQGLFHSISCVDNHVITDRRLVVKVYTGETLKHIVEDIVAVFMAGEGITIGEVQTGPIISKAIFNYVSVTEAYDALKELSGFIWYIDELKKLYFVDRATYAAPWDLDGTTNKPIEGSEHLSLGNPLYRNRQYIRGGKGVTDVQEEVFTGDDVTESWTVGYPLALEPTIVDSVDGPKTVGIKGLETDKDYYWNKGDATIVGAAALAAPKTITVTYFGEYPLIVRADDYEAVLAQQAIEGGTGITEEVTTEAQHETGDAMRESARAKLTQYCRDAEKFIYQTRKSGLAPGQLQPITHAPFGFSGHQMLIEAVSVAADVNSIIYTVTCITGPAMGSWAKFFSSILTRQDKQIKIGEGRLLVLLLRSETLTLAEATDRHEDAYTYPPGVGRWIALPPTQQVGHHVRHEGLALAEAPTRWEQLKGQYCWAPKTNGAGLREAVWDKFSWG